MTQPKEPTPSPRWVLHAFWVFFFTLTSGLLFFLFRFLWHHTG